MKAFAKSLTFFSVLFFLFACGGGGELTRDSDGGTATPPDGSGNSSIALTMVDLAGETSNELDSSNPLNVRATVTDADGAAMEGELVTFTLSSDTLASFSNDTGTALTNSDGVATIGLEVGSGSGSGTVTATIDSGETGNVGFTSSGSDVAQNDAASLDFFASQSQLSSAGSDTIELWAVVKNEQNVLLPDVKVNFSADANASIQDVQSTTDENGVARVNLSTGGDYENRIITATASISSLPDLTKTIEIAVVGTSVNINGSDSVIVNDNASLTISLADSDGKGVRAESVSLTATDSVGNDVTAESLSSSTVTTDSDGRATVLFKSSSADEFTVSASALGTMESFVVTVQQDEFSFVNPPDVDNVNDDIPLGTSETLTLRWLKEGLAYEGGAVALTISRGTITPNSGLTNAEGELSVSVQSSNAGEATIVATGTDSEGEQVSTRLNIAFIATVADTIVVDATPDSIGPDGQTSTISAVVRDKDGNRVRNKLVNFSVNDVSNGSLTDAQARTNKSGIASTVYVSNAITATEDVTVTATVSDNASVSGSTMLTVGDRAFDITLGTGSIITAPDDSSYLKEFSVFVVDADGNPVSDTQITLSALPLRTSEGNTFFKGFWDWDEVARIWEQQINESCTNEDINYNGILNFTPVNEDTNGDNELTPGIMTSITDTVTTDENGQAKVSLRYAKQFGGWATVKVTARSESGGSESSESMFFPLAVAAEDLTNEAVRPPNSPYGLLADCATTD
ncbi:Ig-like domain-containing protein [Alteromonas sp. ASW11-130]|uniref:Ig-like domain-containing protein n=1 Tax=Alteromonas sp. ASW11-130 TaxID=3015775 RepID=UPI002241BEFB|nr:Ig-like domain-containing protein [Alteromonas sp. ASW11-130]MCW8091991.1 Ig-like domain-containing protein [Alteromonas sp. ASW11-130]